MKIHDAESLVKQVKLFYPRLKGVYVGRSKNDDFAVAFYYKDEYFSIYTAAEFKQFCAKHKLTRAGENTVTIEAALVPKLMARGTSRAKQNLTNIVNCILWERLAAEKKNSSAEGIDQLL